MRTSPEVNPARGVFSAHTVLLYVVQSVLYLQCCKSSVNTVIELTNERFFEFSQNLEAKIQPHKIFQIFKYSKFSKFPFCTTCRNIRSLETVMHIPFVLCDDFTVLA